MMAVMSTTDLDRKIFFTLNGLWTRLGLDSEITFQKWLITILEETGYEVSTFQMKDTEGLVFGQPSDIEIYLIIIRGEIFFVELKGSVSKSDVYVFMKKADLHSRKTGKNINRLLMITPFIDDDAKQFAEENQVIICDTVIDISDRIEIR